jgi:hypothetical protein
MISVCDDKTTMNVPDGFHTGAITKVEIVENKGFKYMEVYMTVADVVDANNQLAEIRAGFPLIGDKGEISPNSLTGRLFQRFGVNVVKGQGIDERILVNRMCQYVTVQKQNGQKTFTEVQRDSVKPFQVQTVQMGAK